MLRLSRWISLAIAAGLAAMAVHFWLEASREVPLVRDDARLVSDVQQRRVAEYHRYLLEDHGIDYRVVTARAAGDLNRTAIELFDRLVATSRSESGRGLLLVIDAEADLVRLEVGYMLESVFPDAFVAYIEHRQMVPFFEHGRVADGILAATELIVTRAQNAAASAGFEEELWRRGSGGAGATAPARIGAGPQPAPVPPPGARIGAAGNSPPETLDAYLAAMEARNADPDLPIYTLETRQMLRGWVMTAAQMDSVAKVLRSCGAEEVRISADGRHAVIRYPPRARSCPPHFFERNPDGWALDLVSMQRLIRFGRSNAWRFAEPTGHPYGFAFRDWRFDENGFPRED